MIQGTVVDQSGAPIAGATVALLTGTHVRARTTTTAAGEFSLTAPPAGAYALTVEQSLFEPAQVDLTIADGTPIAELRVVLTVAALREQVRVVAAGAKAVQLDTVSDAGSRLGLTNREVLDQVVTAQILELQNALNSANHFLCIQEGHISLEGAPGAFSKDQISAAYFGM